MTESSKFVDDVSELDIQEVDDFKDVLVLRRHGAIGNVIFDRSVDPPRLSLSLSILATDEEFHQAIADLRRAMNAIRSMRGLDRISDD